MFNDHYVVIASDCVASDDPAQHDASILYGTPCTTWPTAAEIAEVWGPPQRGKSDQWQKAQVKKLQGRIAVVTGAASGIGRGIAVAFARGADIVADLVGADDAAVVLAEIAEYGTFIAASSCART
jgi:NADPH:quinone reductase-like Zn-dependent oxidoreductase